MSIVSSTASVEIAQRDGRFWVHEVHTDNIGLKWLYDYLADAGTNYNAILSARAITLANDLVAQEIASNILQIQQFGVNAVTTINYAPLSQTIIQVRALFATAVGQVAVTMGDWFNARSFAELQAAFGFPNVSSYNNFKTTYFIPNANAATSVRTATGA
jgi:hypothetical protein